jgi:probable addiction module antidote protein
MKFNAADYINDAEDAHYFLAAALEHGDLAHLIKAVGTVSRALGVAKIAKAAGMTRDNLYKTLAEGFRPSFTTINSLLKVFEIDLLAAAAKTYKREKRQTHHTRAA